MSVRLGRWRQGDSCEFKDSPGYRIEDSWGGGVGGKAGGGDGSKGETERLKGKTAQRNPSLGLWFTG